MSKKTDEFLDDVVRRVGAIGFSQAKAAIDSRTLRQHLDFFVDAVGEGVLNVPHYWAVWFHDGRGAIRSRPGKKLVWFRAPDEDPRLAGGRPKTTAEVKRLTRAQFQQALRRNRDAIRAGRVPPVIITTFSGATSPELFFDNDRGMQGFSERSSRLIRKEFSKFVLKSLKDEGLLNDQDVAVGRFN